VPSGSVLVRHRRRQLLPEVRLTFDELALIYKSLEAVKTLGVLPPQDELLADTIQVVDQSLNTSCAERALNYATCR
jgi:hypothetical protein